MNETDYNGLLYEKAQKEGSVKSYAQIRLQSLAE